jgi:hypothetical protein
VLWSLLCRLAKYRYDDDRGGVDAVHDPPTDSFVMNSELMTPQPDAWHRSRLRHRQLLSALKPAQPLTSFQTRLPGKWRCLDFAIQPDKV